MVSAAGLWFVAPREVETRRIELPALGEGDVAVRTLCSGISSGTELLAFRGEIDPDLPLDETIGALGGTFRFPFQYGYSCVGVVEESRSEAVATGSRVFAFHPHQDRFVVGGDDVVPLATDDARIATMFPLVETALQITLDAGAVLGDDVVVFGLGAVGMLTAVLLGRAGARVLAVDPLAWRRGHGGSGGCDRSCARRRGRCPRRALADEWCPARRRGDGQARGPRVEPGAPRTRGHRARRVVVRDEAGGAAARCGVPPAAPHDPQHAGVDGACASVRSVVPSPPRAQRQRSSSRHCRSSRSRRTRSPSPRRATRSRRWTSSARVVHAAMWYA
jgi:hypothetical protein